MTAMIEAQLGDVACKSDRSCPARFADYLTQRL